MSAEASSHMLAWRIEHAARAAYPPGGSTRIGDWQVASSGGGSRRSNSASAIHSAATLDTRILTAMQAHYGAAPTILRLIDLAPDISALLDTAGFAPREGATRTILGSPSRLPHASGIFVAGEPGQAWLATRRHLAPLAEDPAAIAGRLTIPAAYARRNIDGRTVSVGYAALHDGIAVLEAIGTDPDVRRCGHGRAIVAALIDWAAHAGAQHVALQVEETNDAARALYRDMGFVTDLYGYHYRRSASCPTPG